MSLAKFEPALGQEGYVYELSRGVVIVSDVPGIPHMLQVDEVREQFSRYRSQHPDKIYVMGGGSDCKILLSDFESERHPDLTVYLTPPPKEKRFWAYWIPEIVVEVVSPTSVERDYVLKSEEYLDFGIKEYWIIDADRREMLVQRRGRGKWSDRVVTPSQIYETKLLPGLRFDCKAVFAAAERG